jgi:hypothetical protein
VRAAVMLVFSEAIRSVMFPITRVDVTIYVLERSVSMSFVVDPSPLIASSVWPCLDSVSVPEASFPLAFIGRTRGISVKRSLLPAYVGVVYSAFLDGFLAVSHCKVFATLLLCLKHEFNIPSGHIPSESSLDFHD